MNWGARSRPRNDLLVHGAVRDNLRSRAVERSAELPTEADALESALTGYRSVLRTASEA